MNKRPVDRTKKSNIKCEHCKYWGDNRGYTPCTNPNSPKYGQQYVNYYNRCKCFEWKEGEANDLQE